MLQTLIAERLGGERFGKEDKIYKFEKIKRAKRAAQAEFPHVKLIDMGVGEPDEGAFPLTVETLAEEAGKPENRFYTDNGILAFKEAVARYMQSQYGVSLDVQTQINHSIGSKSALALLPACFIDPGDVTLMTVPGYPVMGTWTRYLGGEVYNLPLLEENGFFPDFTAIPEDIVRRAKMLYLNYPNNPTGAVASVEQWQQAIEFCLKNNIILVSDAAYAPLVYEGRKPFSVLSLPGAMECCLELHSMSKGFNMTGWRLGWVCGNELAVKAFATVKDNADSGQFAAIQLASAVSLDHASEITPRICAKYERRLRGLTNILGRLGFQAQIPGGTFYLYVRIPRAAGDQTFDSAEAFSDWLIRKHLISTVPWDDAGHFVRFSATFEAAGIDEEEAVLQEIENRLSGAQFSF